MHNIQHTLFKLLQSWRKELDEKVMMATVLMDLSRAYDCIPLDLLMAKLNAYGIDNVWLLLISDHLSRCKQRMKKGTFYNFWHGIR